MTVVDVDTGEIIPTLASCEKVIAEGLTTFIEVGNALITIRDQRLYRKRFDTFEAYCHQRWSMSRRHANRLIEAAEVVGALGPIGPNPTNEAQARALAPLKDDPEKMAEVIVTVTEKTNGSPTAAAIKEAVDEVLASAADAAESRREQQELHDLLDKAGVDTSPETLRQRGEFLRLCSDLAALPVPASFVAKHASALGTAEEAYRAFEWLQSFVYCWENR